LDGADLPLGSADRPADDRAHPVSALDIRSRISLAQRGGVSVDVPPTHRLLRTAAVFRPRTPRRLRQDLTVYLVPHTHWDREWYRPFQSFRISLVDAVDEVLDLLETDPRMRFTLDGQLATVDDYVEIRPEGEERIRALVLDGRLAIGPWLTLMDELLVS